MKTKKLWALIMALAMTLVLAVPALASDTSVTTTAQQELTGRGSSRYGEISVTLPPVGTLVLNPYQMKATLGEGTDAVDSYHQVFFKPVSCLNKSTFGLKVGAKVLGTPVSGVNLVATAPKDTATDKDVFLYAEFGVSDNDTTEPEWGASYTKAANQIVLGTEYAADAKIVATLNATDGTQGTAASNKWNYLWYKFDGSAAKTPTTAWGQNDIVTPKVAFTFIPTVDTVYAVTVTNTTSKTAGGTAKVNFDIAPAGETVTVTATPDDEINDGNSVPTVTVKTAAGATVEYDTDENQFVMPASDVVVTVKWAAGS